MEKYIYKGKNKETILKEALNELNVTEDEVLIKEKEEKGGLFAAKKVVIEIVKINDIANYGKTVLENILKGFNIEGNIEKQIRNKKVSYRVHSNNNGILIGKNGAVLSSLQKYLKQVINAKFEVHVNVELDIENYKEKQNYFLEKDAKKIARQVTLSKVDVKLDPMNSYQRRIVHNALSKFEYIVTESVGEEPNRCVIIKYKEK